MWLCMCAVVCAHKHSRHFSIKQIAKMYSPSRNQQQHKHAHAPLQTTANRHHVRSSPYTQMARISCTRIVSINTFFSSYCAYNQPYIKRHHHSPMTTSLTNIHQHHSASQLFSHSMCCHMSWPAYEITHTLSYKNIAQACVCHWHAHFMPVTSAGV